MSRGSFISSAVLHGVVLTLMAVDFSFAKIEHKAPPPAILMVDLTRVKIADKTNLPAKMRPQKKAQKAKPQPVPPKEVQKTTVPKDLNKAPAAPKPKPQPPVKEAAPVIEPVQKQKDKKNKADSVSPNPKPRPKPSADDRLKSLLTSVSQVSQKPTARDESDGIEGGAEGDLSQILTISEQDLIASQLAKYWFVDAGKEGIEDIIVHIRAIVNKDGTVRDVQILNMPTDPVKKSVAESARRAVWSCSQAGAFKILAEKYADHYSDWKSLSLRFNPLTGGIM